MEGAVHLSVGGEDDEATSVISMTLDQARALRDELSTIGPSSVGMLLRKALTKQLAQRFIPPEVKFANRHGLVRKDVLALSALGKDVLSHLSAIEIMEEDEDEDDDAEPIGLRLVD